MNVEDQVVERMATAGYEAMHDISWDEASQIEKAMWTVVASRMLAELRRAWEQAKKNV